MPYYMEFNQAGESWRWGPITCDNPRSQFGFEDRTIKRKADKLAKQLERRETDLKVKVIHEQQNT